MTPVDKILIVGAGIGGLGAGAALGQRGIECEIVEIHPEPRVFGVGINHPGNALRALDAIGVLDDVRAAGFEFGHWVFHDQDGDVVVDIAIGLGGDGIPPNCALPRAELHRILIDAAEQTGAQIRYGTTVEQLTDEGDSVTVRLTDGREEHYDLVLGYDGVRSAMRRLLFGSRHDPKYTGYAVWRVTVERPPEIDYAGVYQSASRKGGFVPLTDKTMYVLLVSPEPEGVHYEQARFTDLLRERLTGFGGVIGDIRENLAQYGGIVYQPLSEVMLPVPWHLGRILILGDAAHACTPHLTQGAGMALEDAVVLADELSANDSLGVALDRFAQRRYSRAKFVQDVSRGILEAEMAIDERTLARTLRQMAETLPGELALVDAVLNQPP